MSIELKIKSKHLSLEAKVIRFEERKLLKQLQWLRKHQEPVAKLEDKYISISNHRKVDVRIENRATFLARAYISNKDYSSLEKSVKDTYTLYTLVIPRVLSMVRKYYNPNTTDKDIRNWIFS